ncbi:Transcription factor Pur-alpha 1 [Vitis vinifera]|uniref:Transcription factor Pur-alpha 1 n=1 Tax=Vitis vinifera TaxID=29760 RepID=A0A438C5D6_VITVI|nr:Transcription factor Pur-alpha 1 [Vitis vinifera]
MVPSFIWKGEGVVVIITWKQFSHGIANPAILDEISRCQKMHCLLAEEGDFLMRVSEASVSRNRSTIIVPAGSTRDEGWAAFRNILAEINEASRLFILPNQYSTGPASELNVERSVELPAQDEIGNLGVSKVIRADQKRFFFDLGSNNRGHFLRISEVAGSDRSSIILPLSGLKQFHEMVGHFVEITKDRIEGMTGANVRTVDPPQR